MVEVESRSRMILRNVAEFMQIRNLQNIKMEFSSI